MKRIGLLSDTHGFLDPQLFSFFDKCDELWHAGDFGSEEVSNQLSAFRPLKGVYGNIDGQKIRTVHPEQQRFLCEKIDVWMIHIGGYPGNYAPGVRKIINLNPPKLFICGHSHILKVMRDPKPGLLHINPGAAGKEGFQKVSTAVRFSITEDRIHDLDVIELRKRM